MYEHGGRGPNEWDVYQRSYETNPTMLLQAIERTRHADDDADPARSLARGVAERQRLIDKYEAAFADNDEALGAFQTAVRTVQVWMGARERIKSSNIRCHNEVRMCFDELGRRMVERGHLQHMRADLHVARRRTRRLPGRPGVVHGAARPNASRTTSRCTSSSRPTSSTATCRRSASGSVVARASTPRSRSATS